MSAGEGPDGEEALRVGCQRGVAAAFGAAVSLLQGVSIALEKSDLLVRCFQIEVHVHKCWAVMVVCTLPIPLLWHGLMEEIKGSGDSRSLSELPAWPPPHCPA